MQEITSTTGVIVYWISRIAVTGFIVLTVFTALFYIGRGIWRAVRRSPKIANDRRRPGGPS